MRDAAQGTADTVDDLARAADTQVSRWGLDRTWMVYGRAANNGMFQAGLTQQEATDKLSARRKLEGTDDTKGGRFIGFTKVAEPVTGGGKFGREVVEFAAEYATAGRALRGMGAASTIARVAKATAQGSLAAFVDVDAMDGNLANMAQHLGVPKNLVTDLLAVNSDDSQIEARLKNAAGDAVFGLPAEGALHVLGQGIRAIRAAKIAKADVKATEALPSVVDPRVAAQAQDAIHGPPKPAAQAPVTGAAPPVAVKAPEAPVGTQGSLFPDLPVAKAPTAEDVVNEMFDAIPKRVEGLDAEQLTKLADDFHNGRDFEVQERLGLNPARIDFSKVLEAGEAGALKVEELVQRIADATQGLAAKAGSAPRSQAHTAKLANLLGMGESTMVAKFREKTSNIDGYAWAARQVLAGSAARLSTLAKTARDFVDAPTAPEYLEFLKALEAQAALQAQFKGATSQLARGLASLKGTATARNGLDKARMLRSIVPDVAVDGVKPTAGVKTAEDWLRALGDAKTPAERSRLIDKVLSFGGDLNGLAKHASEMAGPRRWQRAMREFITGNLFSVGTATVNMVGTAGHIGFRALSRLPVHGFAYATGRWGAKEYVATRAAEAAYVHTLMPAFGRGLGRALQLVSQDITEEMQALAGSFGRNAAEANLGKLRVALEDKFGKHAPRFERTDAERTKEWRIDAATVDAWRDNIDHGPALYRAGLRGMIGLATGAFNATGAASRLVRLATIDVSDEIFGTVAQQATQAAEAARLGALEGVSRGMAGEDLARFVRLRSDALMANSTDEWLERVEALVASGAREDSDEVMEMAANAARRLQIDQVSHAEARKILFQDDLNWKGSQFAAGLMGWSDQHTGILFPFIRTPLKILETTLGDYTPLGLLQREMQERIMSGGIDAQIAVSQMTMGSLAIVSAVGLAQAGMIVGHDGGGRSSARLERPSYSMKVGNQWVEYGRLDPFGMLLGLGADIHDYMGHDAMEEDEYGMKRWQADKALTGLMVALSRNILSKSWLTGARDIIAAATSDDDDGVAGALDRTGTVTLQKFVPAGGMMRWWENEDANATREAFTAWDKLKASTFAADDLPEKRDALLGRVVPYDRVLGIKVGHGDERLLRELGELSFQMPADSKTVRGISLTAKQAARLKELRGQVVEIRGWTLEQSLQDLIDGPDWEATPEYARVREVTDLRSDYQAAAIDALEDEDRDFAHAVEARKLRGRLERISLPQGEISLELKRFKQEFH